MSYCTVALDSHAGEERLLYRADRSLREARRTTLTPKLAHVFDGQGNIVHSNLAATPPEEFCSACGLRREGCRWNHPDLCPESPPDEVAKWVMG